MGVIKIRIGIVGSDDSVEKAIDAANDFRIECIPFKYRNSNSYIEVTKLLEKKIDSLDGILFTGISPYLYIDEKLNIEIPVKYLEHDISTVIQTLFSINHKKGLSLKRFSVDMFKKRDIEELFEELELPFDNIYLKETTKINSVNEIIRFHVDLYNAGKIDYCLTSFLEAKKFMDKLNIPCFRVVPTKHGLRKSIETLILLIESNKFKETQVSVGILSIDNYSKLSKQYSEYRIQKIALKIYDEILTYAKDTQSSVTFSGNDEFKIYSTKGKILDSVTRNDTLKLLDKMKKLVPVKLSYGIGGGATTNEATKNARVALEKARLAKENTAYIKDSESFVVGPIGSDYDFALEEAANYENLDFISKESGLSPMTISKILTIITKQKKDIFSANELAELYGCSVRTAQRMLSSLEKSGFAKIKYLDKTYEAGRPRRFYHFNI